jgi:hypothetical protein
MCAQPGALPDGTPSPAMIALSSSSPTAGQSIASFCYFLLTSKFLLVRTFTHRTADLLIALALHASLRQVNDTNSNTGRVISSTGLPSCAIDPILTSLAEVWSQPSFLRHTPLPQQQYVTHALVMALDAMSQLFAARSIDGTSYLLLPSFSPSQFWLLH